MKIELIMGYLLLIVGTMIFSGRVVDIGMPGSIILLGGLLMAWVGRELIRKYKRPG